MEAKDFLLADDQAVAGVAAEFVIILWIAPLNPRRPLVALFPFIFIINMFKIYNY